MKAPLLLLVAAVALPVAAACGPVKPPTNRGDSDFLAPSASASATDAPPQTAAEPAPSKDVDDGNRALAAGDLPGAQKSFEAALAVSAKNYIAIYGLGLVHEKAGRAPQAIESFKQVLALRPDYDDAAAELSALYLDASPPRTDDAILVCRAAIALKPKNAALHNTLAIALAIRGFDQDAALKEFEEALRLDGNQPMFHLSYAQWLTTWKVGGAVAHLDMARQLAKDDYGILASIAHELRVAGEFSPCSELYGKLIAKKDGGEVRTERALCKLGLKDDAGALADLKEAVKKEPGYAPAHYYLGGRYATKSSWKLAATEYEKYLELAPNGSLAKQAAERLDRVRHMTK